MILALAAAVAAAASPCPNVVTPDALVCRALYAQKAGDNQAAAQGFEQAAEASSNQDPKTSRMYAAAGNLWIATGRGLSRLDRDRKTFHTYGTADGLPPTEYNRGHYTTHSGELLLASKHGVFLPFLDATSGHETYGAGRYLDLEPDEDGTYAIDFNLAYHPSCVYSPRFSCPLTPAENRLPVRIEAGERLAEGAGH